jgi:AraC-like DNA-binding protein
MLEASIFNFNDLTVLLAGLFALSIAILQLVRSGCDRTRNLLLAALFLQIALCCADILLYWNIHLNTMASRFSANLFFTLGINMFLQGPLLYWSTSATLQREFRLGLRALVHLIPALAYPLFLYAIYYRFDDATKLQYAHDWGMVNANPFFVGLIWVRNLLLFGYSLFSLHSLNHLARSPGNCAGGSHDRIRWLWFLVWGFLLTSAWHMLVLLSPFTPLYGWGFEMGTMGNYLRLIMMGTLMACLLRESTGFPAAPVEHIVARPAPQDPQDMHLMKLRMLMELEKPYLQPNINVERLASKLEISPKSLSLLINKKLNQNFFEMIRNYRIEEAKQRLCDQSYRQQSINDIMQACGFNSKSVFNQWFKARFGTTPSDFRRQHFS